MASLKLALQIDSENTAVGDLYIHNGTVRLTSSLSEEVAQLLYTRFKMFQGEWFLDTTLGFPWLQLVLGKKTPQGIVAQLFRNVITGCPGIASLDQFNMNFISGTRTAKPTFSCTLKDGTTLTEADLTPFVVAGA